MKMTYSSSFCFSLCLLLLLAVGCVNPQKQRNKRIDKRAVDFAALSSNTQKRVRSGHISIGDAPLTVWFALGTPSREFTQNSAQGTNLVWSYTQQDIRVKHDIAPASYGPRCYRGDMFLRTTQVTETEQQRITFTTNRVISIDSLK